MKKIKIGIAGYGVVGKKRRAFIEKNKKMEIVAVSDILFKTDGTFPDGILFYKDYRKLFKLDIDAIFICLPNKYASEATILSLKNNLHTFCEKPPGKNVKEIKNIIKIEKKYPHLKLKYGFNHRYHDSFIEAKKIINSKKYGDIINIRAVYGKSAIIPFKGGWRSKRSQAGGGILLDQGIHILDMILHFVDEILEIKSFVSNSYWNHDVEDNVYALLKDKNNKTVMLHSTATEWQHKFRLEITLESCLIEMSGILSGSKSYGDEKLTLIKKLKQNKNNPNASKIKKYKVDYSWQREIDEFAEIILKNKIIENGNSADALNVMNIIERIYKSDTKWRKKYIN